MGSAGDNAASGKETLMGKHRWIKKKKRKGGKEKRKICKMNVAYHVRIKNPPFLVRKVSHLNRCMYGHASPGG